MPRAEMPGALPLADALRAEEAADGQQQVGSGGGAAGEMGGGSAGAAEMALLGRTGAGMVADGLQTRPSEGACGPRGPLDEIQQGEGPGAGVALALAPAPAGAPTPEPAAQAAAAPPAAVPAASASSDALAPNKRKDTRSALAKKLGWGSPKRRRKTARPARTRPAAAVKKPKELTPDELEKAATLQREREDAAIARALQEQLGGGYVEASVFSIGIC